MRSQVEGGGEVRERIFFKRDERKREEREREGLVGCKSARGNGLKLIFFFSPRPPAAFLISY